MGQSQPEIVADIRLLNSLHGSGSTILTPSFDSDSSILGLWGAEASARLQGVALPEHDAVLHEEGHLLTHAVVQAVPLDFETGQGSRHPLATQMRF